MNADPRRSLRLQGIWLAAALIVQYALGMYVNLFVQFPAQATDAQRWEFAWSQAPLAAHIVLAILILLGAIAALVRAFVSGERRWVPAYGAGFLAVLVAGACGALFVSTQADAYSYAMSLAFLIAMGAYLWGYFISHD